MSAGLTRFLSWFMAIIVTLAAFFGITIKNPYAEKNIQNVIVLIGDGMGSLHLEKAKQELGIQLSMDTMPMKGYSMTHSADNAITDSAAGATALACGVKTYNDGVGVYWSDAADFDKTVVTSYPKNITELCKSHGMKTGIVTTDSTSGATPADFSAHTYSRSNTQDICDQQLASGIDLIWGQNESLLTEEAAQTAGYTHVDTLEEMNALTAGTKSVCQFADSTYHLTQKNDYTPNLEQMASKAISLLDTSDNGFFLMIEGAHIDKKSHNMDSDGMTEALEEFDKTVAEALAFAKEDGHTLVVVTADHETGGIVLNGDGTYSFTRDSHSSANVPLRVYGNYAFIENGEVVENTEIPKKIVAALEFDEKEFPCTVTIK